MKPPSLWNDKELNDFGVFNMVGFSQFHFNFFLRDPVLRKEYILRRHRYAFSFARGCWMQRPTLRHIRWQLAWFRLWLREGLSIPRLFFGMNHGPSMHGNCCHFHLLLQKENT